MKVPLSAFACVLLAAMISLAGFAALLQASQRWHGTGGGAISASLLSAGAASAADRELDASPYGSQIDKPLASTKSDLTIPLYARQADKVSFDKGSIGNATGGYLPASQLTERPQVLRDIDPEWQWTGISLPVLDCTLLINEYGDVDQVLLREQPLSSMLEQDIRARFLAARFSAGRLDGRPVKSALRIEIRLD